MSKISIKSMPAEVFMFGVIEMVATRHYVFFDGQRVGTVLEITEAGRHWFEAERIWNDEGRGKVASIKLGSANQQFESQDDAVKAIFG